MTEVPQNTEDILPAVRERAAKVIAHLKALGQDLQDVSARRGTTEYADGPQRIDAAMDALRQLLQSIDGLDSPERGV